MLAGLFRRVKDVFISNSNLDHLNICALERLSSQNGGIRVFATEAVLREISGVSGIELVKIMPYSLIKVGKFSILPLPANHATDISGETAVNFLIEHEGKTLFYGLDGAMISPGAWQILREVKLDIVILECALAQEEQSGNCFNHNNLAMAMALKDIMLGAAVASENTKFILSHIPTGKWRPTHDELCEAAASANIKIAYDGYFLGI